MDRLPATKLSEAYSKWKENKNYFYRQRNQFLNLKKIPNFYFTTRYMSKKKKGGDIFFSFNFKNDEDKEDIKK